MVDESPRHHWVRLSNGCDVEMRHGIPMRVSDNGTAAADSNTLAHEIAQLSGFDVALGEWSPGEEAGESEAPVIIASKQFGQVLTHLARSSAVLFVDRFNKAIDADDVDWDRSEYGVDFETALQCCNLMRGDVDAGQFFSDYATTMHEETRRLLRERS